MFSLFLLWGLLTRSRRIDDAAGQPFIFINEYPTISVCPCVFLRMSNSALKRIPTLRDVDDAPWLRLGAFVGASGRCRRPSFLFTRSVTTRLVSCSGFSHSPHQQVESDPTYSVQHERKDLGWKGTTSRDGIIVNFSPVRLIWRTLVPKLEFSPDVRIHRRRGSFNCGWRTCLTNVPLLSSVCVHHSTPPTTSPTPGFGPRLICLHLWSYHISILVSSSGQR